MDYKNLFWIIPIFIFIGMFSIVFIEQQQLGKYDLYNCIYNNAWDNNFNQNPIMINKIQDECICFREYNYTNLLEVNCTR